MYYKNITTADDLNKGMEERGIHHFSRDAVQKILDLQEELPPIKFDAIAINQQYAEMTKEEVIEYTGTDKNPESDDIEGVYKLEESYLVDCYLSH